MGAMHAVLLLFWFSHSFSPPAAAHPDRDALLAFKAGVSDPLGALRSWNQTTHFCRWAGVKCSRGRRPRRVTALDVSSSRLAGTISPAIGNLTSLEIFNFTVNELSGGIPSTLGQLRRLQFLGLCDNSLQGEIPQDLRNCTSLAVVYLNGNHLTGVIPNWLGSLANLTVLKLSKNSLVGEIPPSLGNLTMLRRLELDQNLLEGTVPEGLARLGRLQFLNVYQNRLSGTIPPSFFNMSSLYGLSFANNEFRGRLPPTIGANMPNLQRLLLGGNHLTGAIPASLSNASNLLSLSLSNNSFTGQVPPELGRLCPASLQMSNNELTATDAGGWEFLHSLTNCSGLEELAIDGNMLRGMLPSSISHLSAQLQTLSLGGNQISGTIPADIGNLVGLQKLGLESNLLTGTIPAGIGKLQSLEELSLGQNQLGGAMPSSLGNLTGLLRLMASKNALNGSIPPGLGNLQQLTVLNLSGNALTGPVPSEIFSLSSLSSALDLSDNRLVGPLPREVGRLGNVALLALSGNNFSGEIPNELGNCQSLEYLDLDCNFFAGSIPPSLSNLRGLRRLNLTRNNLSGGIPQELGRMTGLQELYLSRNNLSGRIPELLQNMSSLIALDLSYNHLEGQVPSRGVFANMTGFLMAGNDGLCGGAVQLHLPSCPANSEHHGRRRRCHLLLEIAVPTAGLLVGFILLLLLAFRWRKQRRKRKNMNAAALLALEDKYPRVSYAELAAATDRFAGANLIGAGKYGSVYQGILSFQTKKASIDDNVAVAVKVFNLRQVGASKTFLAECEALRRIRHRNLISIITCCSSVDAGSNEFKALVFELMPNYSLDRWLHPKADEYRLSLMQRMNIAVDVADALDYLHNNCEPSLIHCDLKPSNVLLDMDFTARIGDFGLAKLLLDPGSNSSANSQSTIRGTVGYVAPEYGASGEVSTCGDVYSFGITLLEIFVGKAPTDDTFRDGLALRQFVSMAFPEKIEQVIDPVLLPIEESSVQKTVYDCLVSAIRVGLSCSKQVPSERTSMKDAAAEMRKIRDACIPACGR